MYLEINKFFVTQMVQWTDFLEFNFVLKFTDPDCYDLVHPQGTPRKKTDSIQLHVRLLDFFY